MPRKMQPQVTGGWVDGSLPAHVERYLINDVKAPALLPRIRELVGNYRQWRDYRDTDPAKAEVIAHAEKTKKLIGQLKDHLDLMPEAAKAYMTDDLMRLRGDYYEKAACNLTAELDLLNLLSSRAVGKVEAWPERNGRKRQTLEHALLSDIAALFEADGMPVIEAAHHARTVLADSGFEKIPEDGQTARAAILKIRSRERRN